MTNPSSQGYGILRGFPAFFLFLSIFALTSHAFASGELTVNPSAINFGNVAVGTSQTHAVTLSNSGNSNLIVTQATLSGTTFTLTGLTFPMVLSAGQSVTGTVTFDPPSTTTDDVSIVFSTQTSRRNWGNRFGIGGSVTLPLSGTGIASGQLTANPSNLGFASVSENSSQTLTETLTNSTGSSITISAANTSSEFKTSGLTLPTTLSAGQTISFSVIFTPTTAGSVTGSLAIASTAPNSTLNVSLSGTGLTLGQLGASPASLSFGNIAAGTTTSLSETVTNSGGSPITISQITPSGTEFGVSGITLPLTLAASQSATFSVSFAAPQSGGSMSGTLGIASNASDPMLSVSLAGTGVLPGTLAVSPTAVNFGSAEVGTTVTQTGTLSAGNAAITVSSAGVSGSQFSLSGISLPVTIAAGTSKSFQLAYAPTTTGTASANVTFLSNASNSSATLPLTGTATAAPPPSVTLSWNASTSSGVDGYNLYRGTVSGGPYTRLNSTLNTTMSATDNTVAAGQTYYYVTTAVNSAGTESAYSNQVQAIVPSP